MKNLFAPNDIVIHKNGSEYKIIGRCTIESNLTDSYAYRDKHGQMWIRPVSEMEDGRFILKSDFK